MNEKILPMKWVEWIKNCGNNERKFYGEPATKKGLKEEWCGTEKSYIEE